MNSQTRKDREENILKGPVVVDMGAIQSPMARGRGIAKYAINWALAIESVDPYLVSDYLLDPELPPPGNIEKLLASGKVRYFSDRLCFAKTVKIFHCLWPLDEARSLFKLMPPAVKQNNISYSAVVYDMIMAQHKEYMPQDISSKRGLALRLEILRQADLLFTLSEKVKNDILHYFTPNQIRITKIGAAADKSFHPLFSKDNEKYARELLNSEITGIKHRYILCPTGSHPRKNNERLIKAFLLIDKKIREDIQLVFSGDLPASMANHFQHMVSLSNESADILTTGPLRQEVLVSLYQCSELVVFPSLSEGFGLPIVEALACKTRVIASDIAPFHELIDRSLLFDPLDISDIKEHLTKELTTQRSPTKYSSDTGKQTSAPREDRRESDIPGASALLDHSVEHDVEGWGKVARDSALSLKSLISTSSIHQAISRPTKSLAIVSPLPPATSGIATYTYRLMEELSKQDRFSITAFVDGPISAKYPTRLQAIAPPGIDIYQARSLVNIEGLLGGFDQVLYCFGNSHHHLGALESLPLRPGIVLAHDVRLTNLYRHHHGHPGTAQTGLAKTIREMYGFTPDKSLCDNNEIPAHALNEYGLLLARQVIEKSELYLLHSLAGYRLAAMEAGPILQEKIKIVPFAMEHKLPKDKDGQEEDVISNKWLETVEGANLLCHFGIVDPIKNPLLLIRSFANSYSVNQNIAMAFVGPIDKNLLARLESEAKSLNVSQRILFTGEVSDFMFDKFLQLSDLAIQLRKDFNGEASAAIAETLASGIPTIATDSGWVRTLPSDVVIKVDNDISDQELGNLIIRLLDDTGKRALLRNASMDYSAKYSFAAVAGVLSDIILQTC